MPDKSEIEAIEAYHRMTPDEHWEMNEKIAKQRIRDDAKRPLGVNLAAGLAHSESLLSFKGILLKK